MRSGLQTLYSSNSKWCCFTQICVLPRYALFSCRRIQLGHSPLTIQTRDFITKQQAKPIENRLSNDGQDGRAGSSTPRSGVEDWNSRLDPYLPLRLRSKTWLENLAAFEGVRSAESLPPILKEASLVYPQTILAHLGLVQGKWDAALWLTKALISCKLAEPLDVTRSLQLDSNRIWAEIRGFAPRWVDSMEATIEPSERLQPHETLNALTGEDLVSSRQHQAVWNFAMGQVWQCLGHVIIEASNLEVHDRSRMMSFVYQVIAHVHTEGAASPRIYRFDSSEVFPPICKPPYLHMMSSRIMAALSDAMWKITEPKLMGDAAMVAANYAYKGLEMPGSELNPRVQPLGPEVWLEFILWSCVHGSYLVEAGNLIQHASRQWGRQKWKTRGWGDLQEALNKKWENERDKSRLRQWFDRIAGAREAYSEKPPVIVPGKKTLSREVVAAIAHGLVSADISGADRHQRVTSVWSTVQSCRSLVYGDLSSAEILFWDSVFFTLFEDSNGAGTSPGDGISRKLELAESTEWNQRATNTQECASLAYELAENRVSLLHPTLLRALDQSVKNEDIPAVTKTFETLKAWVDSNINDLTDTDHFSKEGSTVSTLSLSNYVPSHIVGGLLDLVSRAKAHGLGRLLLPLLNPPRGSNIVHRPILSKSAIVQNSLFRFANALGDEDLETSVMSGAIGSSSSSRVSDDLIRELLYSQSAASSWDNVETLLLHMQFERKTALSALDVAKIAALQIRRPHDTNLHRILESILNREYLPVPDYSKTRDYSTVRILNQMSRLLASIPGGQTLYAERYIVSTGQASNPIIIPTDAFNTILWQIVATSGVPSGISFFERWCIQKPLSPRARGGIGTASPSNRALNNPNAHVVQPNMQTLRIIVAPSLRVLQERLEIQQGGQSTATPKLHLLATPELRVLQHGLQNVEEYEGESFAVDEEPPSTQVKVTWERCYEAWMQLEDDPKLEEEIGWAIGMSERLGLERPGVHEQLLRQVEKEEIESGEELEGGREGRWTENNGVVDTPGDTLEEEEKVTVGHLEGREEGKWTEGNGVVDTPEETLEEEEKMKVGHLEGA